MSKELYVDEKVLFCLSVSKASFQSTSEKQNLYYSSRNKAIIANGMIVIHIKFPNSQIPRFPRIEKKKKSV